MGDQQAGDRLEGRGRRSFTKALLRDLRALEEMLREGRIEADTRRIGAEQEMFLVDEAGHPAPLATEMLEGIDDPRFTTELARFNLEANLSPLTFGGRCLSAMEAELHEVLGIARERARELGGNVVLAGILPTIRKSDLTLENMTPVPRYRTLNDVMARLRGGTWEFRIRGIDDLDVRHDSIMVEACNASFQVHFQVGAEEFARFYNIAQVAAAPVLAAAVNSPLLFGRRLWKETRIALFQQAIDTRSPTEHLREILPRVSFGRRWVRESVLELFQEDIARFRSLLAGRVHEDPFAVLAEGGTPQLQALRLHNGTIYRWNRACYGVTGDRPHLRIENRILPAGPTPRDEVANAAFWLGLISGIAAEVGDVTRELSFDDAKANFNAAARQGLAAQFTWFGGETLPAGDLILRRLLPLAREGLLAGGVDPADADLYLGVIAERVEEDRTGAQWLLRSLAGFGEKGTGAERMAALVAAMARRQEEGEPVARWSPADLAEGGGWKRHYLKVEQYMSTDLVTVDEDEPVDLVAQLMDWQRVRHVPVEDDEGRLVGLVSYRALLRLLARGGVDPAGEPVAVAEVMTRNPVTVTPETSTLDAIDLMRRSGVGCLPVVKDGRLVGMITGRDFMEIARELLERKLRE